MCDAVIRPSEMTGVALEGKGVLCEVFRQEKILVYSFISKIQCLGTKKLIVSFLSAAREIKAFFDAT